MLIPKTEETVRVDASTVSQTQYMRERMATDSSSHSMFAQASKPLSNSATAAIRVPPSPSGNGSNSEKTKQEKLRGNSCNSMDADGGAMMKKKIKRKTEVDFDLPHSRPEKLQASLGSRKDTSHISQSATLHPKSNFHLTPSFEQSS